MVMSQKSISYGAAFALLLSMQALQANRLRERLAQGPVICAEGYLFELERRGYLQAGPFVPVVSLEHPEALKQVHREFVRAGSDVVLAFTYYAHRDKLKVIDREIDVERLNRQALRIAKEVANETGTMLAGNICNTWVYNPNDPKSYAEVRAMYDEQVRWAKEEGADFIIAETIFYLGEALIALEVIKQYDLPAVITLAPFGKKTTDGYEWDEACYILAQKGADVVGLNCGRGPDTVLPLLEKVVARVDIPVAAVPVPYHTTEEAHTFQKLRAPDDSAAFPVNLDPFLLSRNEIAEFTRKAQQMGIQYLGVCCGAQPHHIRAMAETLGRKPEASKYSPDMSKHGILGNIAREHEKVNLPDWQ